MENTPSQNDKIKILVVEDEPDARAIFKSLLEVNTPYTIIEAKDGKETLEILEVDHTINLVLLDIIMPEITGLQVLQTVKTNPEKYGTPKVVLFSNLTSKESMAEAEKYHADGYMKKVIVEPTELLTELHKYIDSDNTKS